MNQKNYSKIAYTTAIVSFLFGTVLFISFIISDHAPLIMIGLLYIGAAILINTYTLIMTLFQAWIDSSNRTKLLISSSTLLINIPVVFLYINLL